MPCHSDLTGPSISGWGTKKGAGTGGCTWSGDASWSIYVDGHANNVYFCSNGGYGSVPNAGTGDFKVEYGTCFYSPYAPAWVFSWNGVKKTCHTMNSTTGWNISGGGESVAVNGQDITQRYKAMKYYKPGTGWTDFYAPAVCADSGYSVVFTSYTNWKVK
jgi:hypothetical protein